MRIAGAVALILILAVPAVAQVDTGKIDGRLVDVDGNVIKFANIVVSGPAIAGGRGALSTTEGYFIVADLPPGTYTVRVSHISFNQLLKKDVAVNAGETTSLGDLTLTAGITEISPIVVTASRTEQPLEDAPAAMTVITDSQLEAMPADDYQDVFRVVPGMNVAMMSAGDISINSRRATGVIKNGMLAMIDGRTVYNDFNGTVWWNFLPTDPAEIKQVEVLRGPGSAVWGANAMDGVVNIVTKSPKEMQGLRLMLGAGEIETGYGSATYSGVKDKLGYKLTGGYFTQGPYERPTGGIPGTGGPGNPDGTQYPEYPNVGTEQIKFDARVDYDQTEATTWSVSGGYGGVEEGMLLTPGGPAPWLPGAYSAYAKAQWRHKGTQVNAYGNFLDGTGTFLLSGVDAQVKTQMANIDLTDERLLGWRNLITWGGNARRTVFDKVDLTPDAPDRDEAGIFVQDRILIASQFQAVLGVRADWFDFMGTKVSPRASLLYTPVRGNTFRAAYNRAFRAPTAIEANIDLVNPTILPPPFAGPPLVFPTHVVPNPDLEGEVLNSFELGWVGNWENRVEGTLTAYYNETEDVIRTVPIEFFSSSNPPPGWALPDSLLDIPPPNGYAGIPSQLQSNNVGTVKSQGIEASLAVHLLSGWSLFLNYSWQDFPETEGIASLPTPSGEMVLPLNIAPEHRFNGALAWDIGKVFANAAVTYQSEAFWTDVLDARFWGPTDEFVATNLALGGRFAGNRLVASLNANNIFDERVQQHVWSDIIGRKVWAQLIVRY